MRHVQPSILHHPTEMLMRRSHIVPNKWWKPLYGNKCAAIFMRLGHINAWCLAHHLIESKQFDFIADHVDVQRYTDAVIHWSEHKLRFVACFLNQTGLDFFFVFHFIFRFQLVVFHLICGKWRATYQNQVWSTRINCFKLEWNILHSTKQLIF